MVQTFLLGNNILNTLFHFLVCSDVRQLVHQHECNPFRRLQCAVFHPLNYVGLNRLYFHEIHDGLNSILNQ